MHIRFIKRASAVRAHLTDTRSQRWLGEAVAQVEKRASPYTQGAVGRWLSEGPPSPDVVFAIERVLELQPGSLSRLLGYLPVDAVPARTVREAVDADPSLSPAAREIVLGAYEAARQFVDSAHDSADGRQRSA